MDPFHVVHLAGDALDECRRRTQQELHHRRGRATDPLNKARKMLHTRSCLLTHASNTASSTCSPAIATSHSKSHGASTRTSPDTYRAPDTSAGKALMQAEIDRLSDAGVPRSLTELMTLGRTLTRRAGASWPTSTIPTPQAVPPKPSTAASNTYAAPPSGLRNLTNYITRALLETGGFRPQLHP